MLSLVISRKLPTSGLRGCFSKFPLNSPILPKVSRKVSSIARNYFKQKAVVNLNVKFFFRKIMINYVVEAKERL